MRTRMRRMTQIRKKILFHRVPKQLQLVFQVLNLQQDNDSNTRMKILKSLKKSEAKKSKVKEELSSRSTSIDRQLLEKILRLVSIRIP